MSITPIDMQIMTNNTANVNKVNNPTQQYGENQLNFQQQFKNEVERDNNRTIQTNKSEDERVKDDRNGRGNQYKQNKKKKENEKIVENAEPVKKNRSSSMFDVSI